MKTHRRLVAVLGAAAGLAGCHPFSGLRPDCHRPQDYQRAVQVAPLQVPAGLDAPNVRGALVIPAVSGNLVEPGPKEHCLDEPPKYVPAPAARPATRGS